VGDRVPSGDRVHGGKKVCDETRNNETDRRMTVPRAGRETAARRRFALAGTAVRTALAAAAVVLPPASVAGRCISDGGNGGACTAGTSLAGPQALAISADSRNVYVTTAKGSPIPSYESLDVFSRSIAASTLRVKITGAGRVASQPRGISCPRVCTATFGIGTKVTLRAVASRRWHFAGWKQS
jgi:hypothetical protein